jgi:hypothetical protein
MSGEEDGDQIQSILKVIDISVWKFTKFFCKIR